MMVSHEFGPILQPHLRNVQGTLSRYHCVRLLYWMMHGLGKRIATHFTVDTRPCHLNQKKKKRHSVHCRLCRQPQPQRQGLNGDWAALSVLERSAIAQRWDTLAGGVNVSSYYACYSCCMAKWRTLVSRVSIDSLVIFLGHALLCGSPLLPAGASPAILICPKESAVLHFILAHPLFWGGPPILSAGRPIQEPSHHLLEIKGDSTFHQHYIQHCAF